MPINVFISCAPKDGEFCQELMNHLKSSFQEKISIWDNRQIIAGTEYHEEVDKQLKKALVILLLISSDFLADNYYCGIEMKHAMQRHEAKKAHVIPILLRSVDWKNTPFAKLKVLPGGDKKFIIDSPSRDAEWLKVVEGIRCAIKDLPNSETNTMSGTSVPVHPSTETDRNHSKSTQTPPTGEPSQVQQPVNTSQEPPINHHWFLVSSIILLVVIVIATVLYNLVGATTLQFKEIITEGHPLPVSIVQGNKGGMWFTNDQDGIGKITSDNSITMLPVEAGSGATGLTGITNGPDKNIWFTMKDKAVIGRFNVNVGSFSYFNLPSAQDKNGTAITTGPDGNLWYVLGGSSIARIGCMTRTGASCGEYDLRSGVNPSSIISVKGKLWFTEFDGNSIGWMIPGLDTKPHIISLPGIKPFNMASGPNGEIWFTEPNVLKLGHMSADGSLLAEVPLYIAPESIAIGSDGTIWLTVWPTGVRQPGGNIESLSSDGKRITSYSSFPTACLPAHNSDEYDNGNGITVASNGKIWFTEDEYIIATPMIGHSV